MKKNHKIFLFSFVAIALLTSVIVYAQTSSNTPVEDVKVVTSEMVNISKNVLKSLDSTEPISNTEVMYDELQNKNFYKVSNSKYTVKLDENKNLVGVYSLTTTPVTTKALATKEDARKMIINKYAELNLPKEYELSYLEKFDDEIWQANFEKNYDGIYNKYESVKIFFIPENDEVVAFTIFNEKAVSSDISVSKEDAILTAEESLDVEKSDVVSATLSMEKANDYYNDNNTDTSVHASWVLKMADDSIVYVDATNNNVIGGDCINE